MKFSSLHRFQASIPSCNLAKCSGFAIPFQLLPVHIVNPVAHPVILHSILATSPVPSHFPVSSKDENPASETAMPQLIPNPTRIESAGNKPKLIDEYIGRVNTQTEGVSVARMTSPSGWMEPGQRPEFDEFTVVLKGTLRVEYEGGQFDVAAGQAIIAHRGEWVRYSTPDGAEYIAICLPAFSPDTVHRDD